MHKSEQDVARAYRFTSLSTSLFLQDLGFGSEDAKPGSKVPDVEVERLSGEKVELSEVMEGRPTLIVFGSVSCPMTFGSEQTLKKLHAEFGRDVKFVMLNVREAHPGENFEQPQSQELKREHACQLAAQLGGKWETLVDSIDGDLHRALAPKPNAAFLIAPDRTILFRSLWASDEAGLRRALDELSQGMEPTRRESGAMLGPLGAGLGHFSSVLRRSGPKARRDLLIAAPPVAALAWFSSALRGLAVERRGTVALALVFGVALAFLAFAAVVAMA